MNIPINDTIFRFINLFILLLIPAIMFIMNIIQKKRNVLEKMIMKMISGLGLPTGCLLILSYLDSSILTKVSDSDVYILISGFVIIFISLKTIFQKD